MSALPKRTRQQRPNRSAHAVNQHLAATPRRPERTPKQPRRIPGIETAKDVLAMSTCYALVALLAWMVLNPVKFYAYVMGWLP